MTWPPPSLKDPMTLRSFMVQLPYWHSSMVWYRSQFYGSFGPEAYNLKASCLNEELTKIGGSYLGFYMGDPRTLRSMFGELDLWKLQNSYQEYCISASFRNSRGGLCSIGRYSCLQPALPVLLRGSCMMLVANIGTRAVLLLISTEA